MKKRFIALVLALAMALSVGASAYAESLTESASPEDSSVSLVSEEEPLEEVVAEEEIVKAEPEATAEEEAVEAESEATAEETSVEAEPEATAEEEAVEAEPEATAEGTDTEETPAETAEELTTAEESTKPDQAEPNQQEESLETQATTEELYSYPYYYTVTDGKATIVRLAEAYCKNNSSLTIPARIDGYPIEEIGDGEHSISPCYDDNPKKSRRWDYSSDGYDITRVTIPGTVKRINSYAFYKDYLASVTLQEGIEYIGSYAFCVGWYESSWGNVYSMIYQTIEIPYSVKSIGYAGVGYAYGKNDVKNSKGTKYVSSGSLYCCNKNLSLTANTFGFYKTSIKAYRGSYGESYANNNYFTFESAGDWATDATGKQLVKYCGAAAGNITVPSTYTSIKKDAFKDNTSITSVSIPASITEIEEGAFSGCTNLTAVNVDEGNKAYVSKNGVLYNTSQTAILLYPVGKVFTSFTIPSTVVSIGGYAFDGSTKLDTITMTNRVASIGEYAFKNCTALTSLTLSDNLSIVGEGAFYGCTKLSEMNLTDKMTVIPKNAFYGCTALKSVGNGASVTEIGMDAFYGCTRLTAVYFPQTTRVNVAAFMDCTNLESCVLSDKLKEICNSAFYNCESLKSFQIPATVTNLGASAFYGCKSLKTLDFQASVKGIYTKTFYHCDALESITLPNGLESISDEAFMYCSSLKNIIIPKTVTSIGKNAFAECTGLENLLIGTKVKTIGEKAFYDCVGLSRIAVPDSTETIGSMALGYYYGDKKLPGFVVAGYPSGCAEEYAANNGFTFEIASDDEFDLSQKEQTIEASISKTTININETAQITASAKTELTYASSDISIASVSGGGIVTGKAEGNVTITISAKETFNYKSTTKTLTVHVVDPDVTLEAISVCTTPSKTSYIVGDNLDTAGLTLTAAYSNQKTKTISTGFTCTPTKLTTEGTQRITVTYEGKQTEFSITVNPVPPANPDGQLTLKTSSSSLRAGETFQVQIGISACKGVCTLKAKINYDSTVLKLEKVENTKKLSNLTTNQGNSSATLLWDGESDITEAADLAIVTFTVLEETENCDTTISLAFANDSFNMNEEALVWSNPNPLKLSVTDFIMGDVNGDGIVSSQDLVRLRKVIAELDVTYNQKAADMNEDGNINSQDLIRLRKIIASM